MRLSSLTEIIVVLDRSGSMGSVQAATIEAFNGYVRSQQSSTELVRFSFVQFDDQYEAIMTAAPINCVPELTTATYQPRGSTALFDAIGRTIVEAKRRMSFLSATDRPGTVLFVIQTDGFENASKQFQADQINEMIFEQREKYAWQFVFLGANQDAISSAAKFGIAAAAALSYGSDYQGTLAAFDVLGQKTSQFRRARATRGQAATWVFDASERRRAKGGS